MNNLDCKFGISIFNVNRILFWNQQKSKRYVNVILSCQSVITEYWNRKKESYYYDVNLYLLIFNFGLFGKRKMSLLKVGLSFLLIFSAINYVISQNETSDTTDTTSTTASTTASTTTTTTTTTFKPTTTTSKTTMRTSATTLSKSLTSPPNFVNDDFIPTNLTNLNLGKSRQIALTIFSIEFVYQMR